ncbi:ABC transporter ATP-binding protein [Deinococcus sp. SM5_A1]|uniref:ABC transporter ATP-binding protein n=1 Tax=Deinococcus sp. SM5_A1 TaxID=3379094 RepID=UPI00385A5327
MSSVTFEHVSKDFDKLSVLQDMHIHVESGKFVALVGPSGTGKSTLLRMVAGLDLPTSGQVIFDGEPIHGPDASRTLVFQEHALLPWLSLQDNVALGLEFQGVPRARAREHATKWLARVSLAAFNSYYPHQVSGGMRQRAALVRALAVQPRVLLLDEPFGALDALTRLQLQQELSGLWTGGNMTVLMVTHDVEEALYLADRVIVLGPRPGRVIADYLVPLPRPRNRAAPSLLALRQRLLADLGVNESNPPKEVSLP